MLIARFTAQVLFPSPGKALVTMIRLPFCDRRSRLALGVANQRPLDRAELLGDLRPWIVRRTPVPMRPAAADRSTTCLEVVAAHALPARNRGRAAARAAPARLRVALS